MGGMGGNGFGGGGGGGMKSQSKGGGGKAGGNPNMKPGDWLCPSCGDLQFARNTSCRQCGAARPDDVDAGAPPFKKARVGGADTGDPQKDELINRIKAFQRGGQEQKEAWWNYCDTHLGGNRDPARHDASTLEDFAVC